jgi:hypothetical protein
VRRTNKHFETPIVSGPKTNALAITSLRGSVIATSNSMRRTGMVIFPLIRKGATAPFWG